MLAIAFPIVRRFVALKGADPPSHLTYFLFLTSISVKPWARPFALATISSEHEIRNLTYPIKEKPCDDCGPAESIVFLAPQV